MLTRLGLSGVLCVNLTDVAEVGAELLKGVKSEDRQ
jgi:hypothetical protein